MAKKINSALRENSYRKCNGSRHFLLVFGSTARVFKEGNLDFQPSDLDLLLLVASLISHFILVGLTQSVITQIQILDLCVDSSLLEDTNPAGIKIDLHLTFDDLLTLAKSRYNFMSYQRDHFFLRNIFEDGIIFRGGEWQSLQVD